MDPVFSAEYNKLMNSMDNIRRRINATHEIDSNDPELKRCASSDALEHCHQRLLTIYLRRLRAAVREAVRDTASRELAAAPRDLARSRETTPNPDVCDRVVPERPSSLRSASLENNHQRRVSWEGNHQRRVSWEGNLEAVCIIPGRHDADVQGSAFTKTGHELVRKSRKFLRKLLPTTTTISNFKARSESAAAASRSSTELATGDSRRCKSA